MIGKAGLKGGPTLYPKNKAKLSNFKSQQTI